MKKIFTLFLAGLLLISFAGSVLAQEAPGLLSADKKFIREKGLKFEALKEFKEDLHQINAIRLERTDLHAQVIEKQDEILDLYIAAREAGNKEALKEARELRKQIKDIHNEIKEIHPNIREERKAFKEDVKNEDFEAAREHMHNIITYKTMINEKIKAKIDLLTEIVNVLS